MIPSMTFRLRIWIMKWIGMPYRLNGESWVAAPGPTQLGDLCFSDGKILVIQCFNRDTHNFIWFTVSFDPDYKAPISLKKQITNCLPRAEGYTLYTDDGYSYTVTP